MGTGRLARISDGTRFPGVDPAWSREVIAHDAEGVPRAWHVLEREAATSEADGPTGTLLCVHGNPTWSYLWRRVLAEAPADWRVIAVDQLGMGFSDDPSGDADHPRTLAQRLDDLDGVVAALDITGPLVVAGHDWGGMVAAGFAQRHVDAAAQPRVVGLVLANTAVHHDFSAGLPRALRLVRHPRLWQAATIGTPAFVSAATAVSSPRPVAAVREAYAAPYVHTADRSFVGQFVADIPLEDGHPTRATLAGVADGMAALAHLPALLLRGPKDPVFSEEHLRDLRRRLPGADVHRYEGASHLVLEDAPRSARDIWDWIEARVVPTLPGHEPAPAGEAFYAGRPDAPDLAVGTQEVPWQGLLDAAAARPDEPCVTEMRTGRQVTFAQLEADIAAVTEGFRRLGMVPGDRVALLVPPGIDLTVAVYAAWRIGAVIVVADAGLGLKQMGRALRGAGPAYVVGIAAGIAACAAMRVPGRRIVSGHLPAAAKAALGVTATLDELRAGPTHLVGGSPLVPEHRSFEDLQHSWAGERAQPRRHPRPPAHPHASYAELQRSVQGERAQPHRWGETPKIGPLMPAAPVLPPAPAAPAIEAPRRAQRSVAGERSQPTRHEAPAEAGPVADAADLQRSFAGERSQPTRADAVAVSAAEPAAPQFTRAELDRLDPECAVLFTSGATGPSKGVVYRRAALRTMIGHVGGIYGLRPGDRLVAAFAPFALYGPALGIGAVVPDMDVTKPASLTAAALADAVIAAEATVVFASPAALRNVLATAGDLSAEQRAALGRVREVMSAGAPVPAAMLRRLGGIMPNARPHTPYGMTEVLPVSDITLPEIDVAGEGSGVCVGQPLPGVELRIAPLPRTFGEPDGPLTDEPGVTGEIVVRAAHVKDRYDQLWATDLASSPAPGVHRTGDVGHLDAAGRLWVEGRRVHVVQTADGPATPVALEQACETLPGVVSAAVVGVGPEGAQRVAVVLVLDDEHAKIARHLPGLPRLARRLAPPSLAARVRELAAALPGPGASGQVGRHAAPEARRGIDVSAVLIAGGVPVDIRHESKIDRAAVAAWAEAVLAGRKAGDRP